MTGEECEAAYVRACALAVDLATFIASQTPQPDPYVGMVAMGKTIIAMMAALPDNEREVKASMFLMAFFTEFSQKVPGVMVEIMPHGRHQGPEHIH